MKKRRSTQITIFDVLSEELIFTILDCLNDNPIDKKSFSLVCISFYSIESSYRKSLKPIRFEHLSNIVKRYPYVNNLDLSLCPRVTDISMTLIAKSFKSMLKTINLSKSKFFTHAGLSNLVMNCVNLVEIDLSNATWIQDLAAAAIAEAKNLEKLWLVRCKSISDIGIGCIAVGCRKLKLLSLKWCLGVGDLGVGLVAVKCKGIRCLDLSYLPISNKCLSEILKMEFLEDLALEGCFGVDGDSFRTLKQGCKSLKSLDMSSCQNVSSKGLSSLTSYAGSLQQLTLSYGSPVTLALVDSLRNLSKLRCIKLDGCQITCSGLQALGNRCVSLLELSLSKCSGVTDEGLSSVVAKQKDLKKLDITCCREITHVSVAHITNSCTSLTSLRMESCSSVSQEAFVLVGERCRLLEEIDLTDNEVDDRGLKSISRCSNLSSLKLGLCPNIANAGLIHIGTRYSKLKEIDLYRCAGIADFAIMAIARCCINLEMINIAYCKHISDNSFISLSKCSKLNTLECRGCPLITSWGLRAIVIGCKQLTKLDIKKCSSIDDTGMVRLAHFCQNLRQINLSYTSVTDVGLLSLAGISCLQSLTALHLKGLSPNGLTAALLVCGGLRKVKLQASFRSLLPQHLFKHLEARGCCLVWKDKNSQVHWP